MNRKIKSLLTVVSLMLVFFAADMSPANAMTNSEFAAGQVQQSSCKSSASVFSLIGGYEPVWKTNLPTAAGETSFFSTANSSLAFEGCWSYFPSGSCRAIFRDGQGYQICGKCSRNGTPGAGGCSSISQQTLDTGYWCS